LKKVDDAYEKQGGSKIELDGCLLFVQKVNQYAITKLKRKEK
jgi:hypothetical protein